MDKETKNLLKILGVAIIILYLTRPKSKGKKLSGNAKSSKPSLVGGKSGITPPKSTKSDEDKKFENAVISIKAIRRAIDNNEPKSELDKLNRILVKDYGLKVFVCKNTSKLIARDSKGEDVAKEQ